jgi:peptidoglycan/LPS O-acetylase OafA/YrhL
MNATLAGTGMVCFFILSGFLITSILLRDQNIAHFLIRRFLRIVPLAWLFIVISLAMQTAPAKLYLPHLLFYANWPPMAFTKATGHLWSLCVEMQFYVSIALLVVFFRKWAFWTLPLFALAITTYRFINGAEMAINTYYRVDEILAGCILALIYHRGADQLKSFVGQLNPLYLFPLLLLSAHPAGGVANYARPYIAMLIIGSTLMNEKPKWVEKYLKSQFLFYIASISYALYVIHGGLVNTWLGDGGTLEKYLKRPLLLGLTFALAHVSTFYYEKYWITLGKKLTSNGKETIDKV